MWFSIQCCSLGICLVCTWLSDLYLVCTWHTPRFLCGMCQAGRSKANGGWYYHTGWARVWRASILVQDASAIEGASGWWCWWWARLWLTCLDGRSYAGRQELDFICTNTRTVKTKGNWKTNKQAVDRHHHHHDKHHPHCHYPFSSQPPAGFRRGIIIKRSRARHGVQQQHNTHTYQTHTLSAQNMETQTHAHELMKSQREAT